MVEKLNPKSMGNIGHFEGVRETGSVLLQSTLWGCFELKAIYLVLNYQNQLNIIQLQFISNGLLVGEQRYHKNKRI